MPRLPGPCRSHLPPFKGSSSLLLLSDAGFFTARLPGGRVLVCSLTTVLPVPSVVLGTQQAVCHTLPTERINARRLD